MRDLAQRRQVKIVAVEGRVCPYEGKVCDCEGFPWKRDGQIPEPCYERSQAFRKRTGEAR